MMSGRNLDKKPRRRRSVLKENKERKVSSGWNDFVKYEDVDWDWAGLMRMLYFKIKRMRMYFETSSLIAVADTKRVLKQMDKILAAIARWYDNEYGLEELKVLEKKWGPWISTKDKKVGDQQYYTLRHRNATTPEKEKQCHKEYAPWLRKTERLEQKDFEFVFDQLKKHLKEWWD